MYRYRYMNLSETQGTKTTTHFSETRHVLDILLDRISHASHPLHHAITFFSCRIFDIHVAERVPVTLKKLSPKGYAHVYRTRRSRIFFLLP